MTPEEAQVLGNLVTSLACIVIPFGLAVLFPILAIFGMYFRMGKIVKMMEYALRRSNGKK